MSEPKKVMNSNDYKCLSCGGAVEFDPESQTLKCLFCGHSQNIITDSNYIAQEHSINEGFDRANTNWGGEIRVIKCENCGAETILKQEQTATNCAFCGSSHITTMEDSKTIIPESLIPFKISKKEATVSFKKWVKKRWLAPSILKHSYSMQPISGYYLPYWTYDSNTYTTYSAERGTYYYVSRTREVTKSDGTTTTEQYQERKIDWQWVNGDYHEFFDDVLIKASVSIKSSLFKKIKPYNLSNLTKYDSAYISGFFAERYSVGIKEGWGYAQSVIKNRLNSSITTQIGGDQVRNLRMDINYSNITFKHLLLPIWISSYTFKKKVYNFLVNGQTGKVGGNAPVSIPKILLLIFGIVGVLSGIIILVTKLQS